MDYKSMRLERMLLRIAEELDVEPVEVWDAVRGDVSRIEARFIQLVKQDAKRRGVRYMVDYRSTNQALVDAARDREQYWIQMANSEVST